MSLQDAFKKMRKKSSHFQNTQRYKSKGKIVEERYSEGTCIPDTNLTELNNDSSTTTMHPMTKMVMGNLEQKNKPLLCTLKESNGERVACPKKLRMPKSVPLFLHSDMHCIHIGSAPGKFERNLKYDLQKIYEEKLSITHVVSILTNTEYSLLQIDRKEYTSLLGKASIKHIPVDFIKDGFAPLPKDKKLLFQIIDQLGNEFEQGISNGHPMRVYIHCRLGKHRTGMISCCLLLRLNEIFSAQKKMGHELKNEGLASDPEGVIQLFREKRGQECINAQQVEFIHAYALWQRKRR